MDLLAHFMALEVVILLAGLGLLVGYRLLTGQISTADLFESKELGGLSATRVQMLLVSLAGAAAYMALTLETMRRATPDLPAVPGLLLLLLGGSHVTYLGRKSLLGMSRRHGAPSNAKATGSGP
jgi:hypothetical protein